MNTTHFFRGGFGRGFRGHWHHHHFWHHRHLGCCGPFLFLLLLAGLAPLALAVFH